MKPSTLWTVCQTPAGYKDYLLNIVPAHARVAEVNAPHDGYAGGGRCAFAKDKPPISWFEATVGGFIVAGSCFQTAQEAQLACEQGLKKMAKQILDKLG